MAHGEALAGKALAIKRHCQYPRQAKDFEAQWKRAAGERRTGETVAHFAAMSWDEIKMRPGSGLKKTSSLMDARYLPALYIELAQLGLPVLVLSNGLIDKLKKA